MQVQVMYSTEIQQGYNKHTVPSGLYFSQYIWS